MPEPMLIIEAGADYIKMMSLPQRPGPAICHFEHASRHKLDEPLSKAFAAISRGAAFENAYLSIHPSLLSLRVVTVPFDDRVKINEVLPFELSGVMQAEVDKMVIDNIPLGQGKALAVAVEKAYLSELLEKLRHFRVDPVWAGSAYFSAPFLLEDIGKTGGVKALIGHDFISVSENGKLLFFNNFASPDGLRLCLGYIKAEGLSIGHGFAEGGLDLPGTGFQVEGIELPEGLDPGAMLLHALSVQIRQGRLGETVNFRKGEFAYTRDIERFRKKLRVTAALAAAVLLLVSGDLYMRYNGLYNEYAYYKDTLRASYQGLFPSEKAPPDELYQLGAKLKAMEREAEVVKGTGSPLELLDALAKTGGGDPGLRIRISEVSLGEGRLKAAGEAGSFEAANRFKEALAKSLGAKAVLLSDVKASGSGAAFSLSVNLK